MTKNTYSGSRTAPWEISVHARAQNYQANRYLDAATITSEIMGSGC